MQSYTAIPDTQTIASSLELLLNNDQTTQSNSSGTAFPTTNLILGMFCYRYDLLKLYQLTTITPFTTWQLVCDLNKTPIFAQDVAAQYMSFAGGTFTGNLSLKASQPSITFWDTSEPNGDGIFQWRSIGNAMSLFRNTAASGDFSTSTMPVTFYHTDVAAFAQRPTFNGNTPWDSGNFTPSNYALLAGATFTGNMSSKGGSGAGVSATNVSAWASGSGAFLQLTDSTRTANNRIADFMFGGGALYGRFVADDYSTAANWLMVTGGQAGGISGISLAKRPTWQGGYTPWDSNNFNPANYAPLAGALFTGNVQVHTGAAPAVLYLNANAGQQRQVEFDTGGYARWLIGADSAAESGNNTGSNFFISRYDDSGNSIDSALSINRSNGQVKFGYRPVFGAATPWDSTNFNPANYLPLAGGAITGNTTLSGATLTFENGSYSAQMRADSTGFWGIVDQAGTNWSMQVYDSGSVNVAGNLTCNNGSLWTVGYSGNNAEGVIYFGSTGSAYIFGSTSGINVASPYGPVTLTSPVVPLHLSNSAAGNFWEIGPDGANNLVVYNSSNIGLYMAWGATAWTANSDEKLKNIRGDVPNALEAVESIRTVLHTWKIDDDHAEALGLPNDSPVQLAVIAGDVKKVRPEIVTERNGYLGVQYDRLPVLALAAIKELSTRVKRLEARLAARGGMA
jgi:hypothetical protein